MQVVYEPWLVLLSIVMAIQGAYVGFTLAVQLGDAVGVRRRVLLAGAAFSLAVAIWTMHFVGMLAARISFPIDYLVFPTLLSLLVCVLVVGGAVFAISSGPFSLPRLFLSACLMGGGIFSMHYIGMTALHASAHMEHAPFFVMASLIIAIVASGLALWLATGEVRRPPLILSSVAFGMAVSGMHYTAMAGMKFFPLPATSSAPALSTDLLAIVVAVVAFCVSGVFLLVLVPDRTRGETFSMKGAPVSAQTLQVAGASAPTTVQPVKSKDHAAQFGRGTYAPLGGAGAPPPRIARHLPVERDGATQFIAVEDVVAVHANAHYTYVFNGTLKLFCPLAIGEVESRLDKNRFIRVHRSHIINIDRVIGHRRNGDSELVELTASDHYSVPVSRSRIGWLKSRINARAG
jgi:NO-binding membrane sensor protein with MHYT domain